MKEEILRAIKRLEYEISDDDEEYKLILSEEDWQMVQNWRKVVKTSLTALQEQLDRLENKQVTCEKCKWHSDRDGKHRCTRLHIYPKFSDFYCAFGEPPKEGE